MSLCVRVLVRVVVYKHLLFKKKKPTNFTSYLTQTLARGVDAGRGAGSSDGGAAGLQPAVFLSDTLSTPKTHTRVNKCQRQTPFNTPSTAFAVFALRLRLVSRCTQLRVTQDVRFMGGLLSLLIWAHKCVKEPLIVCVDVFW